MRVEPIPGPSINNPRVIKQCQCQEWQLDYQFADVASYVTNDRGGYSLDAYEKIINDLLSEHHKVCRIKGYK